MENNQASTKDKFQRDVHLWGRITIALAFLCSLSIPVYLTFVLGHYPAPADIISGMISIAGFVGVVWFVEPISYFPTLGPAGTYLAFLSGNIGNMRLPVIAATQDALELEPGSDEAEVAGIYAIISSTFINLIILGVVMVAGQFIVNTLPETFLNSFRFALPGILGAMIVMLGSKLKIKYLVALVIIAVATMFFIRFSPNFLPAGVVSLLSLSSTGIIAVFGIIFALIRANADHKN